MKKGQGATELLIILGVGLGVLLVLFQFSSENLFSFSSLFRENQAQDSLDQIKSAAEVLYQQGNGAKTQVYVQLPVGINTTNVSSRTLRVDFYNGNTIHRSLDFNVSGNLPSSAGSYWIYLETRDRVVYISENLTSISYCGNGVCDNGENCAGDSGNCGDAVCYEPSCASGCGQTAIVSSIDPGECDSSVLAGSCTSLPCFCSSASVCANTPGNPVIALLSPIADAMNTTAKLIDFSYNVTNNRPIHNCSLLLNTVVNMTSTSITRNVTLNFTIPLWKGSYSWKVNCTDEDNSMSASATRNYTQAYIYYLDLWPMDGSYPVHFNTGINSTGNTFWLYGANDGWDWRNWTYMGAPASLNSCVAFTNYTSLGVNIGDENCSSSDDLGQGSGAYGIKFYVDSEVYQTVQLGAYLNLSFDWSYLAMSNELDAGDELWVKATFGNGSFYAYEDFEARVLGSSYQYTGGWGWHKAWFVTGSDVSVDTDEYTGIYSLLLEASNNTVDRALNLSQSSHPFIEFYAKASGLEVDDHASFRVSNNDSTWYVLETWTDGNDDDIWRRYRYDLAPYYFNSSEFWIRFYTPDFENGNDEFRADQIVFYDGNVSYLGKALDTANEADEWNELYWKDNPGSSAQGFVSYNETYNMTPYITGPGWYYLTLGAQVYQWGTANEGARVYFDNVTFYVQ